MAIRWWDPMGDLTQMHRAMDRVFDQVFGPGGTTAPGSGQGSTPMYFLPLDILETENEYTILASVPGFEPEQVDVSFTDGVLAISATQPDSAPVGGEWIRRERAVGNWTRRLQLPSEIQPDKIQAAFESGVLTVSVPKAAKPQPVKIAVGPGRKAVAAPN